MAKSNNTDYWLSDEGQNELFRRIAIRNQRPSSSLDVFDCMAETKAMLSSTATSVKDELIDVELTAEWPSTSPSSRRGSPLQRKGNLYVLKFWLKAANLGR